MAETLRKELGLDPERFEKALDFNAAPNKYPGA